MKGSLERFELTLLKPNRDPLMHLLVDDVAFKHQRSTTATTQSIRIKRLLIEDWVFEMANPAAQLLLEIDGEPLGDGECLVGEFISTPDTGVHIKSKINKYI